MILLYTTPSCQSCKKAKDWLEANHILFQEKNIFASLLRKEELSQILDASAEGFDSIVSKRSHFYLTSNVNFDNLTFNEAQKILIENPSAIRRPILIDDQKGILQVGYNKNDLDIFKMSESWRASAQEGIGPFADEHLHQELYDQLRAREQELAEERVLHECKHEHHDASFHDKDDEKKT